jgi:lipopolysaccharide transport system ATP-binding protein
VPPAVEFHQVGKRYRLGSGSASLRQALARAWADRARRKSGGEDGEGHVWALRDVSFALERGEALGLIGPNGAGKTTILKILSQITQPTEGEFSVKGRVSALIELGAGFHPDLTGRENIYLNGAILGLSRFQVGRLFDRIVAFSGLEAFIDTPVKRYSSGMYVRLGFSVAAHVEPDVLLVDEVLAVGDAHFRQRCAGRIEELLKMGTTIVFVAHNLYLVRSICQEALFLAGGTVQSEGDVVKVIGAYEAWLQESQERVPSKSPFGVGLPGDGGSFVDITDVRLCHLDGTAAEEVRHNEGVEIRVSYQARRVIRRPNLILRAIRTDGTTCFMVRTIDSGHALADLDGSGMISVAVDPIQLAGGAYAVEARLTGPIDGIPLAQAHSGWIRVLGPSPSYQEQSGVYVPKVAWARVDGAQDGVEQEAVHDR